MVVDEATAAKINHLDLTPRVRLDQDVLGLQIAVDQFKIVAKREGVQDLLCNLLQTRHIKVQLLFDFTIILGVLVQVVSEQLCHNEKMFLMIEEVDQLEQILLVQVLTIGVDVSQELNFVNRLVEVILVVLDNLHAHHLLRVDIVALNSFRERSASQVFDDLVTASNDAVDNDREVFGLLETSLFPIKDNSQLVAIVDDIVKFCRVELIV